MTEPVAEEFDFEATERELCRLRLADFFRFGWHVLEPATKLVDNWHIDVIADHVQATLEDWVTGTYPPRIQNLLINCPPGIAKSRIVSVYAPAWVWLKAPHWRVMGISANPKVALRDSGYCLKLIQSDWYQGFDPDYEVVAASKSEIHNSAGGFRKATSVGASITGDRADGLLIDDPDDAATVDSLPIREGTHKWWDLAAANRVNDLRTSTRIGIQQRLNPDDWSAHVLKEGVWAHLVLRMEYESPEKGEKPTPIGWVDPRGKPGADPLLFRKRFPEATLRQEKLRLTEEGYNSQHQQKPGTGSGGIFRVEHFRRWRYLDVEPWNTTEENDVFGRPILYIPRPGPGGKEWSEFFDDLLWSWDFAFKGQKPEGQKQPDFVVGELWGRKRCDFFLLHVFRRRMDFTACLARVQHSDSLYPVVLTKLIEDKANGTAIESMLSDTLIGLELVDPGARGKPARAMAVAPFFRSRHVFVPEDGQVQWEDDDASPALFVNELCAFPRGTNDDQVDACSQGLFRLWRSWRLQLENMVAAGNEVTEEERTLLNVVAA